MLCESVAFRRRVRAGGDSRSALTPMGTAFADLDDTPCSSFSSPTWCRTHERAW